MPTTTELTEQYLLEHPSINDCLKNGIINYSKLSRRIAKELNIEGKTSMESILIACRRYAERLNDEKTSEKEIFKILKAGELEIKNKIVMLMLDKKIYNENLIEIEKEIRKTADTFYAIEGAKVFTLIFSEKYLEGAKKIFKKNIIKTLNGLAMITIKSPEAIESTPGVISYLYSIFGEHGINIIHNTSCWNETIFVILEDDITKTMKFLRF